MIPSNRLRGWPTRAEGRPGPAQSTRGEFVAGKMDGRWVRKRLLQAQSVRVFVRQAATIEFDPSNCTFKNELAGELNLAMEAHIFRRRHPGQKMQWQDRYRRSMPLR